MQVEGWHKSGYWGTQRYEVECSNGRITNHTQGGRKMVYSLRLQREDGQILNIRMSPQEAKKIAEFIIEKEGAEMMKAKQHPMQQVYRDDGGVPRFRKNAIVQFLLDAGPFDRNQISVLPVSNADREQFAQLISYSVSGFSDLGYASPETVGAADEKAEQLSSPDPRAKEEE